MINPPREFRPDDADEVNARGISRVLDALGGLKINERDREEEPKD